MKLMENLLENYDIIISRGTQNFLANLIPNKLPLNFNPQNIPNQILFPEINSLKLNNSLIFERKLNSQLNDETFIHRSKPLDVLCAFILFDLLIYLLFNKTTTYFNSHSFGLPKMFKFKNINYFLKLTLRMFVIMIGKSYRLMTGKKRLD